MAKTNFKQLLLDKGEKIGVAVAGGIAVLLVLTQLFWPGYGLFAPNPKDHQKKLTELAGAVTRKMGDANNLPTGDARPREPASTVLVGASETKPTEKGLVQGKIKSVDAATRTLVLAVPKPNTEGIEEERNFLIAANGTVQVNGKATPLKDIPVGESAAVKLADPEGFTVAAIDNPNRYSVGDLFAVGISTDSNRRMPVLLQPIDGKAVALAVQLRSYILDKEGKSIGMLKGGKGGGAGGPGGMGPMGGKNDFGKTSGFFNGKGGPPPMGGGPGGPPPGGNTGGRLGQFGDNFGRPDTDGYAEGKAADFKMIAIDQMEKMTDMRLAETVRPVRLAMIVASFPYKQQLEEFRQKLRLPSRAAVLAEQSLELDPTGQQYLPAFRFLNVKTQRIEVDAEGKPRLGAKWDDVKLADEYKRYLVLSGRRTEDEDPFVEAISFDRMVMPRLKPMREKQYPELEREVKSLADAMDALKEKKVQPAPPSFLNGDDLDPFSRGSANTGTGQGTGMGPGRGPGPGGPPPMPGPGPGGPPPGAGPGGKYPGPGGPGGPSNYNGPEIQPPDHCLIRLVDVTIQPGKAYKYRIQVTMANPNYKREDVASPRYKEEKELATNNQWFELPDVVIVPPEMHYFAVDQKELDGKDYKGINADVRLLPHQVPIQIHRWVDNVATVSRKFTPVGEWVVAERLIVGRGEYVGRIQTLDVPIWSETREEFIVPKKTVGTKDIYGLPVSFSAGQVDTILVDFNGGATSFKLTQVVNEKPVETVVKDTQRTEVLLWSPEGKLLALDAMDDAANEARKNRVTDYRKRIADLKPKTGTGGIFDK